MLRFFSPVIPRADSAALPPAAPDPQRMRHLTKRSFTIQGHRTSIALEPAFWAAFDVALKARAQTPTALVTEIDEARTTPLASALRVWLLAQGNSSL